MNEFMGRVTYPFRFSVSLLRSSTDLFTHSSMSRTGTVMSLVNTLSGAVNFGVLVFSLLAFCFLVRGGVFLRTLPWGESVRAADRPLRVLARPMSLCIERGVPGADSGMICMNYEKC